MDAPVAASPRVTNPRIDIVILERAEARVLEWLARDDFLMAKREEGRDACCDEKRDIRCRDKPASLYLRILRFSCLRCLALCASRRTTVRGCPDMREHIVAAMAADSVFPNHHRIHDLRALISAFG